MNSYYNPGYPTISYLRDKAKKRIPKFAFEYLDGGCNEETNLEKNTSQIRDVELIPSYLKTISPPDMKVSLLGQHYDAPFGIAPVGLQGLIWPGAAEILAKAAFAHKIPFVLSTVTTSSIERVSEITEGRAWFQLYHPVEKDITDQILQRVESSGYPVLVLLADTPSFGYRPKEIKNGLAMPPRMTTRNIFQIMSRPNWAIQTLLRGKPEFASLKPYMSAGMSMSQLGLFMNKTFNGRLSIDKIAYIRDRWKGKLVLKGIAGAEDAEKAVRLGVDGLIVSNHGGRQLDAGESSIRSLNRIEKEYSDKIEIMMDSGLRSGPDIARTLASGARFTFLGRAFMYGVAALGHRGADHTITLLKKQLLQVMEQISCESVNDFPRHKAKSI